MDLGQPAEGGRVCMPDVEPRRMEVPFGKCPSVWACVLLLLLPTLACVLLLLLFCGRIDQVQVVAYFHAWDVGTRASPRCHECTCTVFLASTTSLTHHGLASFLVAALFACRSNR